MCLVKTLCINTVIVMSTSITKALRVILFTSGLLWLFTGQTIIVRSGITWRLEARLMGMLFVCMYTLSPAHNLLVHLYTHPGLRDYIHTVVAWPPSQS